GKVAQRARRPCARCIPRHPIKNGCRLHRVVHGDSLLGPPSHQRGPIPHALAGTPRAKRRRSNAHASRSQCERGLNQLGRMIMSSRNLFATVLTYAAPSSNYRGESEENRTVLQKITRGDHEYAVISPESMRNALREQLATYGVPCNRRR